VRKLRLQFDKRMVGAVMLLVVLGIGAFRLRRPAGITAPGQTFDYKPGPNHSPGGVPVRPMDVDIFSAIEKGNLTRAQLLDLFPDRPYQVKLVANGETRRVGIVLVDLHRSHKWDERWQLRDDGVFRYTHGADDNASPEILFTLRAGYWIPH
jgi:hypothetical protein